MDHENVNRFIGLSIDGVDFIAVWKMCARGSLQVEKDYFLLNNKILGNNLERKPQHGSVFCVLLDEGYSGGEN